MTAPPPVTPPRAVLFDWDNTLVDTFGTIHEAMNTTLAAMGHDPWTPEETYARARLALREAFPKLFGDRWEAARDIFFARFREIHLETLAVLPGAEGLIRAFADHGIYLAVVSNKTGDHVRAEAAHLGWNGYFGRIIGAADAVRDKPAAEPAILALGGSGIDAGPEVWLVGDTEIDMLCARNAGMTGILVRENALGKNEFSECAPERYFADCDALTALVRSF